MVVVDLLVSVFFYLASMVGLIGLRIENKPMIIIALVIMGLVLVVLAVASFAIDLLVLRIVSCALIVLLPLSGAFFGAFTEFGALNGLYFAMLLSWVVGTVMLGVVDCYDDKDALISSILRKVLPGILLFFAAGGLTYKMDWQIITSIVGFVILTIFLLVVAVGNDFNCLRPCLSAMGICIIVAIAVGLMLYFLADVVWWHSISILGALIFMSVYVASTAVSGETDGVAERIWDIGEMFF